MSHPTLISGLLYPGVKTARAGEHLQFVKDEWARFQQNKPYTVVEDDDLEHGMHLVRVTLDAGDIRIPIAVGEFAYALRSALDQLVWQLALLSGRRPGNKSAFPIQSSDTSIDRERFMYATWNVPCEAAEIIKELQPHIRGNAFKTHPLWQLNKLCNLDKHATIGFSHTVVNLRTYGPQGSISVREIATITHSSVVVAYPIALKGKVEIEPLPPEMVLGKPIEAPGPEFTITSDQLTGIHQFVRHEVLPRFESFFPPDGVFIAHKSHPKK